MRRAPTANDRQRPPSHPTPRKLQGAELVLPDVVEDPLPGGGAGAPGFIGLWVDPIALLEGADCTAESPAVEPGTAGSELLPVVEPPIVEGEVADEPVGALLLGD